MLVLAYLLALAAISLVLQHLMRRYATAALASFVALPLMLTPYWLGMCQADLFLWTKLYTLLLMAAWMIAVQFSSLSRNRWALIVVFLFAAMNILEAVLKDLLGGRLPHYLNAASGLLLILTLASGWDRIVVDVGGSCRDLQWDLHQSNMSWAWVACYTIWNGVFAYLNYPALAGAGTAALGSALVATAGDPARYVQARVYTLAVGFLILFTFPRFVAEHMNTTDWSNPVGQQLGAALSFLLTCSYVAWFAWARLLSPAASRDGTVA
jgi:hypothetical protein